MFLHPVISRPLIFLRERFPLQESLFSLLQTFLGVRFVSIFIGHESGPLALIDSFLIALTVTCFLLLLRIADDLKDYQLDMVIFPQRPMSKGLIFPADLKRLAIFTLILALGIQGALFGIGHPWNPLLLTFIPCLIFLYFMWKWFFIPSVLKKSLPLAFITHNPISIFIGAYILFPFWLGTKNSTYLFLFLLGNSAFAAGWEISRKIRSPSKETTYITYSKIWGPRLPTALSVMALVLASVLMSSPYWLTRDWGYPLLLLPLGLAPALWQASRFIIDPENQPPSDMAKFVGVSLFLFFALTPFFHSYDLQY